jgi:hypothetical protein
MKGAWVFCDETGAHLSEKHFNCAFRPS